VPELQLLRAGHAPAVLAFELANRAYFAASISDRGDEFYERFTEQHNALLAEQEAGTCAFHVLVGAKSGSRPGPAANPSSDTNSSTASSRKVPSLFTRSGDA
jgi:hypothetical protein